MQPRSAKSVGLDFPYQLRTICYFEVSPDGIVSWKVDDGTVGRVRSGKTKLYAVWPGEWSSDLSSSTTSTSSRRGAARDQKGWVVATTSGWGVGRDQAYVRVRRGSLHEDS